MLCRVEKDDKPISAVAASLGFPRPAFYKARLNFTREGLAGLLPGALAPRRAQGDEVNRVVCGTNSLTGTVDRNTGTGAADSKGICRPGASQNRGAGAGGREKKRAKA
jgi:hypothetical protein